MSTDGKVWALDEKPFTKVKKKVGLSYSKTILLAVGLSEQRDIDRDTHAPQLETPTIVSER